MSILSTTRLDIRILFDIFPNIGIVLRIYKSMALNNCLKRIKTYTQVCKKAEWTFQQFYQLNLTLQNSNLFDDMIKVIIENKFR